MSDAQEVPADSIEVLKSFHYERQILSDNFVKQFPLLVHQDILNRRKMFFSSIGNECKSIQKVTFAPQLMKVDRAVEDEFLKGLIRIESSHCFSEGSPEELIAITQNSEFKKRAFSTLDKIQSAANTDCEWTSAPLVGKSKYCYNNYEENDGAIRSAFTFLISNDSNSDFDAPVYLRQTLTAAKKIGSMTAIYVVSYVRSNPMEKVKQFFAEGVIKKMQINVFGEIAKTHSSKESSK